METHGSRKILANLMYGAQIFPSNIYMCYIMTEGLPVDSPEFSHYLLMIRLNFHPPKVSHVQYINFLSSDQVHYYGLGTT